MEPLIPNPNTEALPQNQPVPSKENILSGEPQVQMPAMQTFSPDLADELRKHQGSAMKKIMFEQAQRAHEQELLSDDPRKNMRFILSGVFVIFIALLASVGVYMYQKKINAPIPVQKSAVPVSIIPYEDSGVIDIAGKSSDDIGTLVHLTVTKSNVQTGMIDNLSVIESSATSTETTPSSSDFLTAIKSHITPEFSRSLSSGYMVGIYSYMQPNLFVIFRGTAHDTMLAGMLQWEPYLTQDFAPLFGIDTSENNAYILNTPYTETLIENHDTRAVLNKNGKAVLFYSFLNDNTVIIANDSKTLSEAVRRINS